MGWGGGYKFILQLTGSAASLGYRVIMFSTAINLPRLRFDPTREEVSDFNGEVYAVRRLNLSQGLVRQALHFGPQRHIKRPSSQMRQISEIHRMISK